MEQKRGRVAPLAMARFGGNGRAAQAGKPTVGAKLHPGTYELASIEEPVREHVSPAVRSQGVQPVPPGPRGRGGKPPPSRKRGGRGPRGSSLESGRFRTARKQQKSSSPGCPWQDAPTVPPRLQRTLPRARIAPRPEAELLFLRCAFAPSLKTGCRAVHAQAMTPDRVQSQGRHSEVPAFAFGRRARLFWERRREGAT
jgi:hypothetical protein